MTKQGTPDNGDTRAMDLEELRQRYQRARAGIENIPEASHAYDAASQLRQVLDDLMGDAAGLRATMAYRLLQDENLSLAALADRLKLSKTRADQLIRLAKTIDVAETG